MHGRETKDHTIVTPALPSPFCLQLTIAREQAVLGEYATASVYYDGVLAQIQKHAR